MEPIFAGQGSHLQGPYQYGIQWCKERIDRNVFSGLTPCRVELESYPDQTWPEKTAAEARLRALFDSAFDGIIGIDSEGLITDVNPAAERMFGYETAELIGRNVSILIPSPHSENHNSYLQRYLTTGESKVIGGTVEVPGVRKDGSTFPCEISVSEFKVGNRRGFSGFLRDISARKKDQEALRESAERQRVIFEYAPIGLTYFDKTGTVIACNTFLAYLLGVRREKIIGVHMPSAFQDSRQREALDRALKGKEGVFEGEYQSISGGPKVYIRSVYSPIFGEGGAVIGGISLTEDIGVRKRAEEALRASEERYRNLVENSPMGILALDSTGRVVSANARALDLIGSSRTFASSINLRSFAPTVNAGIADDFQKCLETGSSFTAERQYVSHWGKLTELHLNYSPLLDYRGTVQGVQIIAEDVTKSNAPI